MAEISTLYRDARDRIGALIVDLPEAELARPVPACPGWAVRDVVAHLAGVAEDAVAGRLTGPPDEAVTAGEVARFAGEGIAAILAAWDAQIPAFAEAMDAFTIWPAAMDAITHEQDIRGALGQPGGRDSDAVRTAARVLVSGLQPSRPLVVRVDGRERGCGPEAGDPITLDTSAWEFLRVRMGRRSRAQLKALAWSADPGPVIDELCVFGPSPVDIIE